MSSRYRYIKFSISDKFEEEMTGFVIKATKTIEESKKQISDMEKEYVNLCKCLVVDLTLYKYEDFIKHFKAFRDAFQKCVMLLFCDDSK